MIIKQSINEEFDKDFKGLLEGDKVDVKSFYDLKIQELLEGIVPGGIYHNPHEYHKTWCNLCGRNQLVSEMKESIKRAGFNLK